MAALRTVQSLNSVLVILDSGLLVFYDAHRRDLPEVLNVRHSNP
jgi:hypothetical protein